MSSESAMHSSVFDLLRCKSKKEMDEIYESSLTANGVLSMTNQSVWACKAIFQSLRMQGKCYVMKTLFLNEPFRLQDIEIWASPNSLKEHQEAIEELLSLWLFIDVDDVDGLKMENISALTSEEENHIRSTRSYKLNDHFRNSFQQAIISSEEPWSSFSGTLIENGEKVPRTPSPSALDKYSAQKWEEMLGFLVGIIPKSSSTRDALREFAVQSKLMDVTPKGRDLNITKLGYEYMLKDYHSQVWDFVYSVYSSIPPGASSEILMLLFMLAYCKVGKGYPIDALSEVQRNMVSKLASLGIIYWPSNQSLFFPTYMAVNMIFGSSSSFESTSAAVVTTATKRLSIIVETNLQVLAYLTSAIHLAMLDLFVEVHVRMPNMAVGRITRDKSKAAFMMGISAAQIIDFLTAHAHSTVQSRAKVIPENVIDQLALWEAETTRMRMQSAVMINFRDVLELKPAQNEQEVFDDLCNNLDHAEVLLWRDRNPTKMLICVTPNEGVQAVTEFIELSMNFHMEMDDADDTIY